MAANGEGREAAAAYGPETEQRQDKPVAILGLASLVAADWHLERLVHELDAEVEGVPGGDQAIEAILGVGTRQQAGFERPEPSPISGRGDQSCRLAEIMSDDGDGAGPCLRAQMVDEGAHSPG